MTNLDSTPTRLAVRNLRLCTKDCLCLYVCPTGASDTENSIIDPDTCLGCGACADACPSKAISMVPLAYPPQQPKAASVIDASFALAEQKAQAEAVAKRLAETTGNEGLGRLAAALARAIRLVHEDLMRESGYMLPQSKHAHDLLRAMVALPQGDDFPVEAAERLLELIPENKGDSNGQEKNEQAAATVQQAPASAPDADATEATRTYKCLMCGAVFSVAPGVTPRCPVCGAGEEYLELQ